MSGEPPRAGEAGIEGQVSVPDRAWGADVLGRLELRGDETVLDAGCGTGRVTAELLKLVPRGRVIGIDGSASMVAQAQRLLPPEVDLQVQDLNDLALPDPVDAVVSTATFHWIADHERLFLRIAGALVPAGQLQAQCGGVGNIASVDAAVDRLRRRAPWDVALTGWNGPWNFATPEETTARLTAADFVDVRCWLEPRRVTLDDAHSFLRTVVLGSHLARLPEEAHDRFVEDVRMELLAGGPGHPALLDDGRIVLDFVRLNISARRRGSAEPRETEAQIAARLRG